MKKIIVIFGVFLSLFCAPAFGLERFEIISTEELEKMLVMREQGNMDFILVNSLDEIIYQHASIPGSINIPWSRVGETINRAGKDMDKLLIFY